MIATFPSLKIDIERYTAVKQHLMSFGLNRLEQSGNKGSRKKTNNQWFETQDSISYWEDFSKQKIIYPDIMRMPSKMELIEDYPYMYLDDLQFYIEATNFMMTGENIDIIYLFLISDIGFYAFSKFYSGPQFDATGFRYKKAYLDETFVPRPDRIVTKILRESLNHIISKKNNKININKIWFDFIGFDNNEITHILQYKKQLLENLKT